MPETSQTRRLLPDLLDGLAADHPEGAGRADIVAMIEAMVMHPDYPCLGARSVFTRDRARVVVLEGLGTAAAGQRLHAALTEFAASVDPAEGFASLVAVFRDGTELAGPRAVRPAPRERALRPNARHHPASGRAPAR